MPEDRIQREIEDILSRLDDLPAERKPIPMRRRSRQANKAANGMLASLGSISTKHVMLGALGLIVVGFVLSQAAYAEVGRWTLIAGALLFVAGIVLSAFNKGEVQSPEIEKRWRGQPMNLGGPTLGDRLRSWFNTKRR